LSLATIEGARAIHQDHLIGSLEAGKRADLIVVDMRRVHTMPRFETTGQNVYSRLVYGTKSTDVCHVMVNGRVLLRDRELLTVDEEDLLEVAQDLSKKISAFFVARERDLLNKLLAIGGLDQQETFEVQVKARIPDGSQIEAGLSRPEITVTQQSQRKQYDTYFIFAGEDQGRIRYREDDVLDTDDDVAPIYNLVYTGPIVEQEYENSVVLTRSRFASRADRSLRFYREYFQPFQEREIVKHRRRYHVRYKGMPFFFNVDQILEPQHDDLFVEIKSRTWSARDAVRKAQLIGEILELFGIANDQVVRGDYIDLT
jgi:5-methylthioadenosine/S-adenosylhomocysteine deaminase